MKRYGVICVLAVSLLGCTMPQAADHYVQLQPGPMVWGHTQTDEAITAAITTYGTVVVPIWPYALEDQAQCHGDWTSQITLFDTQFQAPYPPCDTAAYTAWVRTLAEHYADQQIIWQVLASPDQQIAPTATFIGSSKDYAELVGITVEAMHAVNPAATIVLGNITTLEPNSITFFTEVLTATADMDVAAWTISDPLADKWPAIQSLVDQTQWSKPVWIVYTESNAN